MIACKVNSWSLGLTVRPKTEAGIFPLIILQVHKYIDRAGQKLHTVFIANPT